jgi:hypothetical protein
MSNHSMSSGLIFVIISGTTQSHVKSLYVLGIDFLIIFGTLESHVKKLCYYESHISMSEPILSNFRDLGL